MSPDHTRKQFLAKLLGFFAATGFISKLKATPASAPASASSNVAKPAFSIRQEPRAISRSDLSV